MKVHHGCPVQATINALSGKWKVQVVWRLSFGALRFAELRELERDGIVKRREVRSSPPKVTYSLSPAGQTLIPVLQDLCDWGSKQFGIKPNLPRPPHSANHS
jgi:DNA-binding HxlR family transcriptional regulator